MRETKTIKSLDFQAPIRTVSEMNQSEHWAVRMRRKHAQQLEMLAALHQNLRGAQVEFPCKIRLTRIGPKLLDHDNLASSTKFIQDAIARHLGIDDGDTSKVTWEYDQLPIGRNVYAVKVTITPMQP